MEDFTPEIIPESYLIRRHYKDKNSHFKLLLSDTDRDTLMAVMDPMVAAQSQEPSIRIKENHAFFLEKLRDSSSDLAVVCRGISKLLVVEVALSRDQDNAMGLIRQSLERQLDDNGDIASSR